MPDVVEEGPEIQLPLAAHRDPAATVVREVRIRPRVTPSARVKPSVVFREITEAKPPEGPLLAQAPNRRWQQRAADRRKGRGKKEPHD